jgi:hypothetical protein
MRALVKRAAAEMAIIRDTSRRTSERMAPGDAECAFNASANALLK